MNNILAFLAEAKSITEMPMALSLQVPSDIQASLPCHITASSAQTQLPWLYLAYSRPRSMHTCLATETSEYDVENHYPVPRAGMNIFRIHLA